jgi:hypothetical protein
MGTMVGGVYRPDAYEIAGFDLCGERQSDGSIKIGFFRPGLPDDRTHLPAFPEQVQVEGVTYELEFVKENEWEGRAHADPDDDRLKLCWGVYV